jgi:hypothetical protein
MSERRRRAADRRGRPDDADEPGPSIQDISAFNSRHSAAENNAQEPLERRRPLELGRSVVFHGSRWIRR